MTEAVKDKLAAATKGTEKPWVKHMGKLKAARINRIIEEDSEQIGGDAGKGQPRRIDEPAPTCAVALGLE